jgi:hypothetical protein
MSREAQSLYTAIIYRDVNLSTHCGSAGAQLL